MNPENLVSGGVGGLFIAMLAALGIWKRQNQILEGQKEMVKKETCRLIHSALDVRVAEMKLELKSDIHDLRDDIKAGNKLIIEAIVKNGK